VRGLITLRREHPTFRRRGWFHGRDTRAPEVEDVRWCRPDGVEMTSADWDTGYAKSAAALLDGRRIAGTDVHGQPVTDDDFFVAFNAYWEPETFILPEGRTWTRAVDSADDRNSGALVAGPGVDVQGRSMVVLRASRKEAGG
jgi:isoamylase